MAGTPTTNYNIPTYADTDAPDLSGAYNDAMGIIDTQLKANADTTAAKQDKLTAGAGIEIRGNEISATATGGKDYTAGSGITISGTTISNKQATGILSTNIDEIETSGITADYLGGVLATANSPDSVDRLAAIDDAVHGYAGAAVPTVKALKGYVEQKMAAAGAAYMGAAPIVVDNGAHTVSFAASWVDHENTGGTQDTGTAQSFYRLNAGGPPNFDINTIRQYPLSGATTYPTVNAVRQFVAAMTPAATTSVKGLVQLTSSFNSTNETLAANGKALFNALNGLLTTSNMASTNAMTPLTTEMLANLYVTPSGMVVYKAPTD